MEVRFLNSYTFHFKRYPEVGIKLLSLSWKVLKTGSLLALSLQFALSLSAQADESGSGFGSILPQSSVGGGAPFRTQSPFSDMMGAPSSGTGPGDTFSAPSLGGAASPSTDYAGRSGSGYAGGGADFSSGNSALQANQATDISGSAAERAWYKFLEPSLNLARQLEAQRKRLLSIVPMPLNLRGTAAAKSDNRLVLLRAENSPDYACFKTIYGLLFARSSALTMVATGKNVRVMNVNGKEKDVLFQLANGQVITIGPGSEMVISRYLDGHEVNIPDGIARRGFTKQMKCNDLSMAFSQFSHESLFASPEMQYFLKVQNKPYVDALNSKISALNEIRGTTGFKKAFTEEELKARRKIEQNKLAEAKTQSPTLRPAISVPAKAVPVAAVRDEKAIAQKAQAEDRRKENARKAAAEEKRKNATAKAELENRKLAEDKAIDEQRRLAIAKAKAEEARLKQDALQKKLAKKKSNTADVAAAAAAVRDDDFASVDTAAGVGDKNESTARRILGAIPSMKWKATAAASAPKAVKSVKSARPASAVTVAASSCVTTTGGSIKMILPRVVPTEDTPPEIAKLLSDALQEEKNARLLRKKADKCMSFADCGMLSYEQQKKMLIEARQHIKEANEAEERCQALRRQAQTASSGRASVQ